MPNETKKEELSDCCGAKAFYYNYLPDFPKCKRCGNPFISSPHIPTGDGKHIHQHIDHSKCSCGKECDCDKNEVPTGEDWEKDMEALRKEWSDTVAKLNDGALAMYSDLIAEWWISKQSSLLLSQEKQWKDEMAGKIEELSSLEHEQWMHWAQNIANTENIKPERLERWSKMFVQYSELNESEKEQDRIWARKVLSLLSNNQDE